MASKKIIDHGGISLWGSLDWRVLPIQGNRDAALRQAAKDRSASYAIAVRATQPEPADLADEGKKKRKGGEVYRNSAGFFSPPGDEKVSKCHSVAAAFAKWLQTDAEHANAVLFMEAQPGRFAVVVLLNGMPVLDRVEDTPNSAYALVSSYLSSYPDISIFAEDVERFPRTLMNEGLLDALIGVCDKSTLITPVPVDFVKIAVMGVVLVGGLLGKHFYAQHVEAKKQQELLEQSQANDPENLYRAAFEQHANKAGLSADSLMASISVAKKLPVYVEGWKLRMVECDMLAACQASYQQITGDFEGLKRALPDFKLQQSQNVEFSEAVLAWDPQWQTVGLDPQVRELGFNDFVQGPIGSRLQSWMTARLSIKVEPPAVWPQVQGVSNLFKPAEGVASGKVEITGLPLPLTEDAIENGPKNVRWTSWVMNVGGAKDAPLDRLKVNLTGYYYVKS